jgi:Aerotolerance regulator N-terminal/von Willebrand factor type A domain
MTNAIPNMSIVASIGFVHPALALAGAACGAIPIVIHFLNRRRHRRVQWAAMRFLLLASRRSARRLRLEQFLLLAVRIAVVVLVGLLVARPYFPASGLLPFVGTGVHRIIVVDNSLSMSSTMERGTGLRSGSGSRFDAALRRSHELLAMFSPRDAVSIVTLSAPATTVVGHAAFDRRFLSEAIDSIAPTQASTDIPGGVRAVLEILEGSSSAPGNRAVYFVSDFQRSDWLQDSAIADQANGGASGSLAGDLPTLAAAELGRLADAMTNPSENLVLVQVDGDARRNASVASLSAESAFVAPGLPLRFEATVGNHGDMVLQGARVQFRSGGRILGESPVAKVAADGEALVSVTAQFAVAGTHTVEARLLGVGEDHLAIDDTRFHTIEVREKTRVLIVDPRASARFNESEGAYLAAALDPGSVASRTRLSLNRLMSGDREDASPRFVSPFSVELSSEHELAYQGLPEFDVVALCNVPSLSRSDWERLASFVEQGGGLLVFLGDDVNVESYKMSESLEGGALLPATLLEVARPAKSSTDAPGRTEAVRLSREGLVHPFVREFARQDSSGLFDARIEAYMRVRPDAATGEVLWTYTNGQPAWILGSRGRGSVLLCTTSANMRWNTLPAKGDYVSLMLNAVSFAARGSRVLRNVDVGGVIRERLSAVEASLPISVSPPADFIDEAPSPATIRVGNGLGVEVGPVTASGAWGVRVGGSERFFSVNVDPSESLLQGASASAIAEAVGRKMRWVSASAGSFARRDEQAARSTEVSRAVLWTVVGLVILESLLAMLFGKPLGKRRDEAAYA